MTDVKRLGRLRQQLVTDQVEIERLKLENAELLNALTNAFTRSCERAESRVKWTAVDQRTHEVIKAAITRATKGA